MGGQYRRRHSGQVGMVDGAVTASKRLLLSSSCGCGIVVGGCE